MTRVLRDRERMFIWMAPIFGLLIMGSVLTVVYWSLDREYPLIDVEGEFIGWDESNSHIGWVQWTAKRQRSCQGKTYRWLVNSVLADLPGGYVSYTEPDKTPVGKTITWAVAFERPDYFKHNGAYRIRIEYACNPLQRMIPFVVNFPDVPFKIDGPKVGPEIRNKSKLANPIIVPDPPKTPIN